MKTSIIRIFAVLMLLASFALSPFVKVVHADGALPTIDIVSVKAGESVTIRTHNFPANQLFSVRMGKYGTQGVNGTLVDTTNSGSGGSFDVTYKIPAGLKDEGKIAIRLESASGYYSYNWFTNASQSNSGGGTPAPGATSGKLGLTILAVEKDKTVKVRAEGLPANQTFTIRIGTYANFFRDYVVAGTFGSGSGGTVEFTSNLPEVVKGVELVSIRIDSAQKVYAYNAFKNATGGGSTGGTSVTPAPATGVCQIVSVSPGRSLAGGEDFDAVWEVKNVSGKTWEMSAVDYKYVSGAAWHEKSVYDLQKSVANGETFKIVVDMKAAAGKGDYRANWALVQGGTTLCNLSVGMTVK
jgi:hypothetical protein